MKSKLFTDLKLNFCIPTASLLLLASFDASAQSPADIHRAIEQTQQQVQQLQARVSQIPNAVPIVDTAKRELMGELTKRDALIKQLQDAMGRLEAQVKTIQQTKPDTGQKGDPITKQTAPTVPPAQTPTKK